MTEWSAADILAGKMLVGGPRMARFCPDCSSPNVSIVSTRPGNETIKCSDCGAKFGGASARA